MQRVLEIVSCCALVGATIFGTGSANARGQGFGVREGVPIDLHLAGESIPAAPHQSAAWKAPDTKLSKEFVSATTTLFQQGLADPRGCEYREIEVVVGGSEPPWTDEILKTHGWVIPDAGKQAQRFGVCWNGLVYPLASMGKRADLRADARTAAKADLARAQGITGWYFVQNFENFCLCHPSESRSVSHESPLPIKACLLMRLGEAELAEKLWNHWTAGLRSYSTEKGYLSPAESVQANKPLLKDPYLVLANCWTLALFDRVEAAHMRGDDRLSLASAATLSRVWPAVEAEAAKRGFRKSSDHEDNQTTYFLLHVDRARELLTDQQRRAKDRKLEVGPPVRCGENADFEKFEQALTEQLRKCLDRQHRIALLIREMEEASLHNCGASPGDGDPCSFGPATNTLVRLLADQGESAVEPLLACLESDNRLSRTQRRERRYPLPVYRFAEPALELVLKMPFREFEFRDGSGDGDESKNGKVFAARIRTYWKRYKDSPPAERWYGILADDHALPSQRSVAARAIVQRVCFPVSLDSAYSSSWQPIPTTRKIHGEVLRNKTNPSVAELMAKRVKEHNQPYDDLVAQRRKLADRLKGLDEQMEDVVAPPVDLLDQLDKLDEQREELEEQLHQHGYDYWTSVWLGCDMALYLARWDPAATLPVLREQTETCRQILVEDIRNASDRSRGEECLVQLFVERADAGDPQALDEYAKWLKQFVGSRTETGREVREKLLEPLWHYPESSAISEVAEWLFNDKHAPCDPLLDLPSDTDCFGHYAEEWMLLRGPLVVSPAFRKQVLRSLEDKSKVVVYEVQGDVLGPGKATRSDEPVLPPVLRRPPLGTKLACRVCDLYAHHLAPLDGTPRCELFWPEDQRDRAVAACAAFLKRRGHRLRPAGVPVDLGGGANVSLRPLRMRHCVDNWRACKARLAFRLLDRPATPDDVRKGETVISLTRPGAVRVCRMPDLPLEARWVTLKDYPVLDNVWVGPRKWKRTIGYDQDGMVWQAEEQRQADGRWRRYYGFVGRYGLAKVPAEEIEFTLSRDLITPFDGTIWSRPEQPLDEAFSASWTVPEGLKFVRWGSPPVCRFDTPLVCRLRVRNLCGVQRKLPPLAIRREGVEAPVNAVTMEVRLLYCRACPYIFPLDETATWTEVAAKASSRLILKRPAAALGPAETFEILEFDLTDHFDVTRPGIYRVSVRFGSDKAVSYKSDGTEDIGFELLEKEAAPATVKPLHKLGEIESP